MLAAVLPFAACSKEDDGNEPDAVPSGGTSGASGAPASGGKLATTGLRPMADKRKDMELLAEMVARGEVRAVIDRTYPLARIAEAHAFVETESKSGDVIIAIGA